jgi:hypothetical protein
MKLFLQRFAGLVLGCLSGFDRLVFKGKLRQLYAPQGLHCYLSANHVLLKDFDSHVQAVTRQVVQASLATAERLGRPLVYLNSSQVSKEDEARRLAQAQGLREGLIGVLQSVEPCWSFAVVGKKATGRLEVVGQPRRCSFLYHYSLHPQLGLLYVRLQTWFPFEVQVGLNGREWLCRQLERAGLAYRRSDNKLLWVADWPRAQQLLDEQPRTAWPALLDELLRPVHPLHPGHLGRLPVAYNWTVSQSEWATDVAFARRADLQEWYGRWLRQAVRDYGGAEVLRFLGRSGPGRPYQGEVSSDLRRRPEGARLKHRVGANSLKTYDHETIWRVETTINEPKEFRSYRAAVDQPEGPKAWRVLQRSVADMHRRTEVSQAANERYLEALAGVAATRSVQEVAEPLCRRAPAPGKQPGRKVRALNPLAAADAALLTAVADPKWMVNGLRNRDLVAALYAKEAADAAEKRRRSARVTRLLRLLRGHGLLHKVPRTHRYQVSAEARQVIVTLLAARNANAETLSRSVA